MTSTVHDPHCECEHVSNNEEILWYANSNQKFTDYVALIGSGSCKAMGDGAKLLLLIEKHMKMLLYLYYSSICINKNGHQQEYVALYN